MAVTLKQLARELELDHSTVAYALSGKGTIKDETRRRVQAKAEELGYVPNTLARRMRQSRTRTIGLVIPDVVLVYNELVQQIFHRAVAHNYEVQIALSEFDADLEDRAVRSLLESRVDGMIVKSRYAHWDDVPANHGLRQAANQGVPVVCYGYGIEGSPFPEFSLAIAEQGRMATQHLIEGGQTRLAWLFPVRAPLYGPQRDRIKGSKTALTQAGFDAAELQVLTLDSLPQQTAAEGEDVYGNYVNQSLPRISLRQGRALMRHAMSLQGRPNGILCHNEATAIGAILEAQSLGLEVPRDVAIVATVRTVATEFAPVSLTTVDVPPTEAASQVLQMLLHHLEDENEANEAAAPELVAPVLVVGRSTRAN